MTWPPSSAAYTGPRDLTEGGLRFTLSLYYLTELKEERVLRQPNQLIKALDQLRKYTNQLAERCWEISIEANGNDQVLEVSSFFRSALTRSISCICLLLAQIERGPGQI